MKNKFLSPLLLAALVAGCGRHPVPHTDADLPAASVSVATVEATPHSAHEDVVGTVRARVSARVESKVSGRIAQLLVAPGQTVKTGDLLVEVDAAEIRARLDQANALLAQAQRDHERTKQLLASNAVSKQEADAAEARLQVARSAVSEAETMQGYTRITAPFDGVVTRKIADVGDLAMPGKPLLALEAPQGLRFEADVPEALIDHVKQDAELPVRLNNASAEPLIGRVTEISPAADAVSRTYLVKLDLPDRAGLRAGQFGRVQVPVGESTTPLVPRGALSTRGQMEFVTVVKDGRAALRIVRTGRAVGEQVEIISGLEPGEQVVVSGAARDGQRVEVKP